MRKREGEPEFTKLRKKYDENLFKILREKLGESYHMQAEANKFLKNNFLTGVNSGDMSMFFRSKNSPPPVILLAIGHLPGISINKLMDEAMRRTKEDLRLTENITGQEETESKLALEDVMTITTAASDKLITDPSDSGFQGYLGSYYVYFTPTFSDGKGVLQGELTLTPAGGAVRAHFELITTQPDGNGDFARKKYDGTFIYSAAVSCCYCILSSKEIGEMCFLMFNHFKINHQQLECAVAVAMTASAGGSERSPTVHRMLLSSEKIREVDLKELIPLLRLNSSELMISEEAWEDLANRNETYAEVMKHILSSCKQKATPYYQLRETMVRELAHNTGKMSEEETAPLVAALRASAMDPRYNKVSQKADAIMHDFLIGRGYYKRQ